jgi:hypothetical protein
VCGLGFRGLGGWVVGFRVEDVGVEGCEGWGAGRVARV